MNKKIGLKLIAVVGMTAIIIIGVYAYINIESQREVLLAEVERHANQLSETVKRSTRQEMLYYHQNQIGEMIRNISEDPCLHEIRILNKEGMIKYSTTESEIGTMVDKNTEHCYACHAQDKPLEKLTITERTRIFTPEADTSRVLGIINPIYNDSSCWTAECHAHSPEQKVLGVLDVTFCLRDVDNQILKSKIHAGMFAIIAIVAISFLIGIFVKRWVDRPVNYLLEATKQVGAGNLNYIINKLGDDELGLLARSFNNMTMKLAEARQQLFQSDKMASLGRLAAGVAHEINNPLTGVLTYSSFLLKRTENLPDIQDDLKVIVRETLRSREIVKGLLDFARQSIPKKKKANLNEVIDKAIQVVENQLRFKRIKINTRFDTQLPEITLDVNQVQQVYINLMLNAGDAISDAGGEINISTAVIHQSLYGNQQIKQASCGRNHSLIDEENKIGGMPSIKVKVITESEEGYINIDPIYGKHRSQYDITYTKNNLVQILCPECEMSLVDESETCPHCLSPLYSITIPSYGVLKGCTKFGCHWQKWEIIDRIGEIQYVISDVADSGCGIAEGEMIKIFEPFYTTKAIRGTGLGLSVVWGIINNHGGTISVKSEENKGTIFTIKLPVEQII